MDLRTGMALAVSPRFHAYLSTLAQGRSLARIMAGYDLQVLSIEADRVFIGQPGSPGLFVPLDVAQSMRRAYLETP